MKLDRLEIEAFGALEDFSATDLASADVLVLLGPNESGKSTIQEFVTTILFGFSPATREQHPYAPWSGVVAEGSVTFVLSDGSTARVHRRLMSAPRGLLQVGKETHKLANGPVPWVGSITRDMYRGLFALTADQALELREGTWSQVEDRLLGGSSYSFLRPAREVTDALKRQADQLWRPDRRGKPRARQLEDRLRGLKKERAAARSRTERVLEVTDGLAKLASQLDDATCSRTRAANRLRRAEVLLPVHRVLERIETLRQQSSRRIARVTLPPEPRAKLDEGRQALEALREVQDEKRADRDTTHRRTKLSPEQQALLAAELDTSSLVQQVEAHHSETSRVARLTSELEALSAEAQATRPHPGTRHLGLARGLAGVLVLVALGLGVVGVATDHAWLAIVSGALIALAAGIATVFGRPPAPVDDSARREAARIRTRLDDATRRVESRSNTAAALLRGLGRDHAGDAMDAIPAVQRDLRDALVDKRRSDDARQLIPALEERLTQLDASIERAERSIQELEASLATLDAESANAEVGLALYEEATGWEGEARALERNLHVQTPQWQDYAREAKQLVESGDRLHLDTEERNTLEIRVGELDIRIPTIKEQMGKLQQERDDILVLPGADHIEGEIESLQEDLDEVERQRDRLCVLRSLVRVADLRFREEHQPPVLRTASRHAAVLTDGRYTSLSSAEGDEDGALVATMADSPFPLPVQHPLSRGTRQQLYLSIRLALADHIDGTEPLPLLLDEMFVNWDPTRTSAGLRVLRDIGRRRQILLLTCQPRFAATVREAIDARVVDLGAVRG